MNDSKVLVSTEVSKERRSRRFWVFVVLAFFSLDITIAVVAIVMAAGDPSFRPMPDYGDSNVTWEVHHQERLESTKLGWKMVVAPQEPDRNAIRILVTDNQGKPVVGARGELSAYHFTRVMERTKAEVREVGEGEYLATVDCKRDGMWKIEVRLEKGEGRFLFQDAVEFHNIVPLKL